MSYTPLNDLEKIAGTPVDVNIGNASAGTLRVIIASDQPAIAVTGGGGGGGDVQYADGATQSTPTGTVALGKNPSNILHSLALDAGGNLVVSVANSTLAVTQSGSWSVGITGSVAVTGTFFQATQPVSLTVLPPLVAGSAVIGHVIVDAAPTTAVTGTFFQATQPVSIAATVSTNLVGGATAVVKAASTSPVVTDPALVVSLSPNSVQFATSVTANTLPGVNPVSVGTSSVSVLSANASRKEAVIVNTGTTIIYLGLGQTPTTTAYHIALPGCTTANDGTGGSWITDMWKDIINAIGSAVSGTVCVTEMT